VLHQRSTPSPPKRGGSVDKIHYFLPEDQSIARIPELSEGDKSNQKGKRRRYAMRMRETGGRKKRITMKGSEINTIMRSADQFIRSRGFFLPPVGRFPTIEEDEEPLYLLCNDYKKYYRSL
jgi:hypothetical protein